MSLSTVGGGIFDETAKSFLRSASERLQLAMIKENRARHALVAGANGVFANASVKDYPMFVRVTWLCVLLFLLAATPAFGQRDSTVPPQQYYFAFGPYFDGDYKSALDAFESAARGGIRSTEGRWIDSICYHTMIGECYYRMGNIAEALVQYNSALKLAVFHGNWMLRVDFPPIVNPSASAVRSTIKWGVTKRNTRLGRIPDTMVTLVGRLDNDQALRGGRNSIMAAPEFYPLNAKEIARCTALAIFRRREIMGPVCEHDELTRELVATLSRRPTRPNHWSQAWISSQLGMAYASAGKTQQAMEEIRKSLVLAGQYDHELTALGLLELGRLTFEQGQNQAAAGWFLEATFAAAAFDQYGIMQDAFRGGLVTHLVSGQKGMYAPLAPATVWARRNSRALRAELALLAAENAAALGQNPQAIQLLGQARQAVGTREMRSGMFGARFNYQSALVDFQRGNLSAGVKGLASSIADQKTASRRLFQIGLVDGNYVAGKISQRVADDLFDQVLREPTARDWAAEPMETLAVAVTPNLGVLHRWHDLVLWLRNDQQKAVEISDRIRRHRFFSTLPMGGRLLALRWVFEAPDELVTQQALLQRQDLLARYPNYAKAAAQSVAVRQELGTLPLAPDDPVQIKKQTMLFEQLAGVSASQEVMLREIALRREPSEFVFPPLRTLKEIQETMSDDQLVLGYLVTNQHIAGYALAKDKHATWQLAGPATTKLIATLLDQLGLSDRKVAIDGKTLKSAEWRETSAELLRLLSNNADPETWGAYREVVIVPDGPIWYVPFEALQAGGQPLISKVQIRYVPTISLVGRDVLGRKPKARTAVITGRMFPGQNAEITVDAFDRIGQVLPDTSRFSDRLPAPSAYVAAACDRLVVLSDLDQKASGAYAWAPMQVDHGKAGGNLESWMALPWHGPSQVVLPGFHTSAETALKRGATGNEMFLAACGLMASGSRSVLLSRWPAGGQSTFDLIREYVQELPFVPAAEAWQRSVRLAHNNLVDPEMEPRLNASGLNQDFKADHPFFWAGYMLIDTGSGPKKDAP